MCLACLGRLGPELIDECLQPLAFRVLFLGEPAIERLALAALPLEGTVAAAIEDELSSVKMEDPVDRVVEQVAIVADHHHRVGIAADMLLEPERGLEVEVVGRLIEQQQVGLGKQRCCEPNAHAPATGELVAGALLIGMGEAEAGENGGRARGRRMGGNVREPRLDLGNAMGVALGRRRNDEVRALGVGRQHNIEKAFGAIRSFLCQPADSAARRQHHLASFRRDLSGNDPQQRGLACTVAADKPDPGASRQGGGRAVQQGASADLAGDVVETEHAAL